MARHDQFRPGKHKLGNSLDVAPDRVVVEGRPETQKSPSMLANFVRNMCAPPQGLLHFPNLYLLKIYTIPMAKIFRMDVRLGEVSVEHGVPLEARLIRTDGTQNVPGCGIVASLQDATGKVSPSFDIVLLDEVADQRIQIFGHRIISHEHTERASRDGAFPTLF